MDVRGGPKSRLSTKELMLLNCGAGEDSSESLGQQGDQINLERINPEYSLEGLMLKLQCFHHLMRRANSLEKTAVLGKIEGKRRRGRQGMRWLDSVINSMNTNLSKFQETVKKETWCASVHGVTKSWTRFSG